MKQNYKNSLKRQKDKLDFVREPDSLALYVENFNKINKGALLRPLKIENQRQAAKQKNQKTQLPEKNPTIMPEVLNARSSLYPGGEYVPFYLWLFFKLVRPCHRGDKSKK